MITHSKTCTISLWAAFIAILLLTALPIQPIGQYDNFRKSAFLMLFCLSSFFLLVRFSRSQKIYQDLLYPFMLFVLFILWNTAITAIQGFSLTAFNIFLQLLLVLCFFSMVSLRNWSQQAFINFGFVLSTMVWVLLGIWFFLGHPIDSHSIAPVGMFLNTNVLGMFAYSTLFFIFLGCYFAKTYVSKLFFVSSLGTNLILLLLSNSRSSEIGLLVTAFTYLVWKTIIKNKLIYSLYFWLIFFSIGLFILIYMHMLHSLFSHQSNHDTLAHYHYFAKLSYQWTGKSLGTRYFVWNGAIQKMSDHMIIGHGLGIGAASKIQPHNLYMQIILNSGIVGLGLFLAMMYYIWSIFRIQSPTIVIQLAGAFTIGILTSQMFEVALLQTNLSVGLIFWLLIGIGISAALKTRSLH